MQFGLRLLSSPHEHISTDLLHPPYCRNHCVTLAPQPVISLGPTSCDGNDARPHCRAISYPHSLSGSSVSQLRITFGVSYIKASRAAGYAGRRPFREKDGVAFHTNAELGAASDVGVLSDFREGALMRAVNDRTFSLQSVTVPTTTDNPTAQSIMLWSSQWW